MCDILRTPTGGLTLVPLQKKKIPEKNSGGETCFFCGCYYKVEFSNVTELSFYVLHIIYFTTASELSDQSEMIQN